MSFRAVERVGTADAPIPTIKTFHYIAFIIPIDNGCQDKSARPSNHVCKELRLPLLATVTADKDKTNNDSVLGLVLGKGRVWFHDVMIFTQSQT